MRNGGTRIYVLTDTTQKARRDKLIGIYGYAHKRGWTVRTLEISHPKEVFHTAFAELPPDGLILDGCLPPAPIPKALRGILPIVAIDIPPNRLPHGAHLVHHDDAASARLAAKSLLDLGLENFATLETLLPKHWSNIRTRAFSSAIREAKRRCSLFRRQPPELFGSAIRKWRLGLPKPCGIFAPNDALAKTVVDICNELDLSIPGDVAVIGVDNDDLICNTTTPALSSVAPDFHLAGRLAAQKLDDCLRGNPPLVATTYGPSGDVQRRSSRRLPANRRAIGELIEFIRTNACLGIHVGDVLNLAKTPKSTTELHFRQAVGHSIAAEIQRVRMEAVCALLRNRSVPISTIAAQCGYRNDNHLKNLFRRKFGKTMSDYRKTPHSPS